MLLFGNLLSDSNLDIQSTSDNNKKLQTHTDLVLTAIEIIVPGMAPRAKENVRTVKVSSFTRESLLFSSNAP